MTELRVFPYPGRSLSRRVVKPPCDSVRFGLNRASEPEEERTSLAATPAQWLQAYANPRFSALQHSNPSASLPESEESSSASKIFKAYRQFAIEEIPESSKPQTMTFWQYLRELERKPTPYLRSSSKYTVDAMEYYGTEKASVLGQEITRFNLVKRPWRSSMLQDQTNLEGQEIALDQIHGILKQFATQKTADKMIVLHGPNGSGKNEIMNTLFQALENYSKQDAGARYTFSWVFSRGDELKPITMPTPQGGKSLSGKPSALQAPGLIPSERIALKIPANLNTNPVFLLPAEDRVKLLQRLYQEGKIDKNFNADFVIEGGRLDSNSKAIFDALMERYKGDIVKVFSHVQVERWTLSKQHGRGLSTIQSGPVYNAGLQPITGKLNLELLPSSLYTAGVHLVKGSIPDASGGHVQLTDMLKKHPEELKFLLETAQTGMISIQDPRNPGGNHEEQLDAIFWADVNDKDIIGHILKDPAYESLQKRFRYVQVPYIREYKKEAETYRFKLKQMLQPERHITPHALEAFALWATMTRLFTPTRDWEEYKKIPGLSDAISGKGSQPMSILEKALLYQGENPNSHETDPGKQKYNTERLELLRKHLGKIAKEHNYGVGKTKFLFYEGGNGLSIREAREMLEEAASLSPDRCFSVMEVFKSLNESIKHGLPYFEELSHYFKEAQSKNIPGAPSGKPPHPEALLNQVEGHVQRQIQSEIKAALGIYRTTEEHTDKLLKYIEHVKALMNKQSVAARFRSPTYSDEGPDKDFILEMERVIKPQDLGTDTFRREKILSKRASWDRKLSPVENIKKLYKDELLQMLAQDEQANRETLRNFKEDIQHYWRHPEDFKVELLQGTAKHRATRLHRALGILAPEHPKDGEHAYCSKCLPEIISWAFDEHQSKH